MDKLLLIALLGGFGVMLGWGITDFFAKKTVNKIGDAATLFWMQFLGIFPLLFIFIFNFNINDINLSNILLVSFWALVDGAGYLFFFRALEKGKVSIISPIVASYSAFSVIISAIIFGEKIEIQTIIFLLLIFFGIMIASVNLRQIRKDVSDNKNKIRGIPEALFAVLLFAIWFPFWNDFINKGESWITLLLGFRIFIAIFVFLFAKYKFIPLKIKNIKIFRWIILMALLDIGAYLALTWSYSKSNYTSLIAMLSSTFFVPTLILAKIFLKERLNVSQWIGITLIFTSIILLALYG